MKSIFVIMLFALTLTSCSFSATDEGLKVDGGELGKFEATDEGLKVDGGKLGTFEATDEGLKIEGGEVTNKIIVEGTKAITEELAKEMEKVAEQATEEIKKLEINIDENEGSNLSAFTKKDEEFYIRGTNGAVILNMDNDELYIRGANGAVILNIDNDELYVRGANGAVVLKIDEDELYLRSSNGVIDLNITDDEVEGGENIDEIIKFGDKTLEIGDIFKLGDNFSIGLIKFTEEGLIIGDYIVKEDGLYKGGKKVKSIDSIKDYITKDGINFNGIIITKNEIKFGTSSIKLDKIKFSTDKFITENKAQFNNQSN